MGSREVYDYKLQKWVPYVSDPEKWYQHFLAMRDGYVKPNQRGHYIVGAQTMMEKNPNMESAVAQEMTEVKKERKKRKKTLVPSSKRKKIYKSESGNQI